MSKYVKEASSEKKIIQIKPVDLIIQKNHQNDESNPNEQLHKEVNQLELRLEELKSDQSRLLKDTKDQIEKEKNNWKIEKEKLMIEAKEKGYQDGFASGKQETLSQYNHLLKEANQIIHRAKEDYQATLEKSEETIVELAIHISEKILKQRFSEKPSTIIPIVKDAIKQIEDQSEIRIFLHPKQYENVLNLKDELLTMVGHETKLSIFVKDELMEDACIIEHPFGRIDASVDTQLEQIRSILQDIAEELSE